MCTQTDDVDLSAKLNDEIYTYITILDSPIYLFSPLSVFPLHQQEVPPYEPCLAHGFSLIKGSFSLRLLVGSQALGFCQTILIVRKCE